jgi:hypothetical protein
MKTENLLGGAALAFALALAGQALADGHNNPAPAGPVVLDLAGTAVPHSYVQYTTSFIAGTTSTDLSFAFRDDPAFLHLDDVVLTTGGGANLLVNGDFESGVQGDNAPVGWTYLNVFGANAAGVVDDSGAHGGLLNYDDGAVQAYDAITQNLATVVGQTYNLSFWLFEDGALTTFQHLSTNGDTTTAGGNGVDLIVYAGNGVPVPAGPGGIPEPASWAMMLVGFFGAGAVLRAHRKPAIA